MIDYKLIVTALLENLTEDEFLRRMKRLVKAQEDFPAYVPNLSPTAEVESAKITKMEQYIATRDSLTAQQKANTGHIVDLIKDMKNDVISKWCPQVQEAVAGNKNKVKELALGIKGEDDQQSEPEVSVTNSHPSILMIDLNSPQVHTLILRNNITGKIGKPKDALRTDVYIYIGNDPPADYTDMKYLGKTERGKYVKRFTPDQVGQAAWYYAIYVPRKSTTTAQTASKVKAIVT